MDFHRNENGIFINQKTYIRDILLRFGMENSNPVLTPLDTGTKLVKGGEWKNSDGEKPPYRELVGSILYLSIAPRHDMAHAASVLSQFNELEPLELSEKSTLLSKRY